MSIIAEFLLVLWLFWMPLGVWWVISPKHFPFNPNLTRAWTAVAVTIIWLILLILSVNFMPETPTNQSNLVGFFSAVFVAIGLIVASFKAKKRHDPNQLQAFIERQNQRRQSIQAPPIPIIQTPPPLPTNPTPPVTPTPSVLPTTIDFEFGAEPVAVIDYTNANGERSYRSIIVRDVFFQNNTWQVRAVDINKSQVRQFRIDRMASLEHNGYLFTEFDEIKQAVDELSTWI